MVLENVRKRNSPHTDKNRFKGSSLRLEKKTFGMTTILVKIGIEKNWMRHIRRLFEWN